MVKIVLMIVYLAISIVMCGILNPIFEEQEVDNQITRLVGYIIVILSWPVLILLGIGRGLYNATKKDD